MSGPTMHWSNEAYPILGISPIFLPSIAWVGIEQNGSFGRLINSSAAYGEDIGVSDDHSSSRGSTPPTISESLIAP